MAKPMRGGGPAAAIQTSKDSNHGSAKKEKIGGKIKTASRA